MKIFVVRGQTGEYSDRTEWPVKAFTDEDKAKEFVVQADAIARELYIQAEKSHSFWSFKGTHPLDSKFEMDYTGTSYYYEEVELK